MTEKQRQIPPHIPGFELELLVDALTAAAPLIDRLHVVSRQQAADAARASEALTRAVAVVRRLQPRRQS